MAVPRPHDRTPPPSWSRFMQEFLGATLVATFTLMAGNVALGIVRTLAGEHERYVHYGPVDGILSWLVVATVAWTLAFFAVERRRDARAGEDPDPALVIERRLQALAEVWWALPRFLLVQAGILYGMMVAAALWWGANDAVVVGVSVGVFLPFLGLLLPWWATSQLLTIRRGGPARSSHVGVVLLGVVANGVVLLGLAFLGLLAMPAFLFPMVSPMAGGQALRFPVAILGCVFLQFSLRALVDKDARK